VCIANRGPHDTKAPVRQPPANIAHTYGRIRMGHSAPSTSSSAPLSTTAIAAIATGIGISLICIIALIFLLIRAVRNHKQFLADLEERGLSIAKAQGGARDSVTRPRAVLRRNSVLPYRTHRNSGWGALTSVETINSADPSGVVAHYVPLKPTEAARKGSRLSWPFHTRSVSGHNINLKKMKGARLSTVLEDPKPSALVPVLDSSHLSVRRPSLVLSTSSSRSLLQHHPAFRDPSQEERPTTRDSSVSGTSFFRAGANDRLQRAKSFADVPSVPTTRPQLRARSASLCSHASSTAPDVILPPLPLDIARIKNEAKRRSELKRIPSKQSETSVESADTSILVNRASPVVIQVAKRRPQKITKPRTRGSGSVGGRAFRDSLDLRTKVLGLRRTPSNSPTRTSITYPELESPYIEQGSPLSKGLRLQAPQIPDRGQSIILDRLSLATTGPENPTCPSTPKRKLTSQAYSEISPERQKRSTAALRGINGAVRSPKRQHSQTSSRSSGGNPFQWDPPLSSTGKPSALKGSPSARQGHRRKNSVRISLVPTFHGPPSRTPSPSFLIASKEDTIEGATADTTVTGLGLVVPGVRSLPTPPSSSTFSPELKPSSTSLRASLTSTSPTLSLVSYDQIYVVLPTDQVPKDLSKPEGGRISNGSVLSMTGRPGVPSSVESSNMDDTRPVETDLSHLHSASRKSTTPDTPYLPQSPFRPETPENDDSLSYSSLIDFDNYDTERLSMIFQTPTNTSSRTWQSAFAAIPEESSVSSQRTLDFHLPRHDESTPVSPKTLSPPRFDLNERTAYNLPVYATVIPEETSDTIDPAILGKDDFMLLNSSFADVDVRILNIPNVSPPSLDLVTSKPLELAAPKLEPLFQAEFSSSPPTVHANDSPVLGHRQSEASSVYSLPASLLSLSPTSSPIELPSPLIPCSPRPSHAQLPDAAPFEAIDFAAIPGSAPSPQGSRRSPPRPLRTSIAALRRMNSDAAKRKKEKIGRGERQYLRLGREDSVPLPGDESWLDEMEDNCDTEASEPEVIDVSDKTRYVWDEGFTVLGIDEGSTIPSTSIVTPDIKPRLSTINIGDQEDTVAGAQKRVSNTWDDDEKFWTSVTPQRHDSSTKPKDHYQPSISSPPESPTLSVSTNRTTKSNRRRDFEVAKDSSPTPQTPTKHRARGRDRKKLRESNVDGEDATARALSVTEKKKKKSVLGNATPNVMIQVTDPSGQVMTGVSGSLYDSQGFLRY
jgi:hypothetical protein